MLFREREAMVECGSQKPSGFLGKLVECGSRKPSGFLERLGKTGKPKGPNKVNVFDSTSKKKGLSAKLFGNDFAYDAIKQSLCMPIM